MPTVSKKKSTTLLGEKLRSLREAAGFTQQEVATELGVSYQTYFRWEQGKTEPSFTELCQVARMFGKTPNDFATDPDPE